MIRTLWLYVLGIFWTVTYGIQMIAATTLGWRKADCICERNPRRWSERILRASGCSVRITGAEHVDPDVPQIVVSNHESWFDVFALAGYLPGRCRFVAKKELAGIPVFGRAIRRCGHIFIDRGDRAAAIASLDRASEQIRSASSSIVMFPEGTRTRTGELQPFKKGAFVLAIQAGVPVVPVAVVGTRRIMPKGDWRIRPGPIEVRIGQPIPVDRLDHDNRDALRRKAFSAVKALRSGTFGDLRSSETGADSLRSAIGRTEPTGSDDRSSSATAGDANTPSEISSGRASPSSGATDATDP